MANLEKLERLQRLRESGALTEEEYEREKASALSPPFAWLLTRRGLVGLAVIVAVVGSIVAFSMPRKSSVAPVTISTSSLFEKTVEPPFKWEKLGDGSLLTSGEPGGEYSGYVMRCWKDESRYDCLSVGGGEWKDAVRFYSANLPQHFTPDGPGYDCSIGSVGSGYQEHISGKLGQLTEHVVSAFDGMRPNWSRDYVEAYFKANAIAATKQWFACRPLAMRIQAGSSATIGSSEITRAVLNDKPEEPHIKITASWLRGTWGPNKTTSATQACDTDGIVTFKTDGTYRDGGSYGRYRTDGNSITYFNRINFDEGEGTEDRSDFNTPKTTKVRAVDQSSIVEDGDQYWRCSSG